MSRSRVISPLAPVLTTISPNSSSLCNRPWALMESLKIDPASPGGAYNSGGGLRAVPIAHDVAGG